MTFYLCLTAFEIHTVVEFQRANSCNFMHAKWFYTVGNMALECDAPVNCCQTHPNEDNEHNLVLSDGIRESL